ncbi:MAG: DNA-processing protein DprA [Bacteroidales bacterium]|nr:DNA-processing protein DprA [Bacteroidales bacterium]
MSEQELLYTLALTMALRQQPKPQRILYDILGSATAVYECRHDLMRRFEHFSARMAESVSRMDALLPQCQRELEYMAKHGIRILDITSDQYPARLRACEDAPLLLYTLGNVNLNAEHIISVVGTRRCSQQGRDLCQAFLRELAAAVPNTLVVSGLAYGIDIAAHRASLASGLPTAAVLAHGLDEIYPSVHRQTAIEMLTHGGLVTEFTSHTTIDRLNFLQRNRIVAGMADAVVVVESPARGGSLNTARLAADYHREVFAFPGRPSDLTSQGCNLLIRRNAATLITSCTDLLTDLGWATENENVQQPSLFPDLSSAEQALVDAICNAHSDLDLSELSQVLDLPSYKITPLTLSLELKGVIKVMPGNRYHVVGH